MGNSDLVDYRIVVTCHSASAVAFSKAAFSEPLRVLSIKYLQFLVKTLKYSPLGVEAIWEFQEFQELKTTH